MRAKNLAEATLSCAGTMVWSRTMAMSASFRCPASSDIIKRYAAPLHHDRRRRWEDSARLQAEERAAARRY